MATEITKPRKPLTEFQRRFKIEYLHDFNGTRALQRAQKSLNRNISTDVVAKTLGSQMLSNPNVSEAISKARDLIAQAQEITPEWVAVEAKLNVVEARKNKQYGASNGALTLLSKFSGGFVERTAKRVDIRHVKVVKYMSSDPPGQLIEPDDTDQIVEGHYIELPAAGGQSVGTDQDAVPKEDSIGEPDAG